MKKKKLKKEKKSKQYNDSRKCSKCRTKESNMYFFYYITKTQGTLEINLCGDCVANCFTRLLTDSVLNTTNMKLILSYINETKKS